MTWNNIRIYNSCPSTDYTSILIGGLFGISLITLTIYGILADKIRKKAVGVQILKLLRYNILTMFIPVIIITIYVILIMFYEMLNNQLMLSTIAIVILIYTIVHTIYVLQIFYNPQKVKEKLIKENKKEMSKISKKMDHRELEKKIIERINQFPIKETINEEQIDIIIDINDLKELLAYYLYVRNQHKEKEYSYEFCNNVIEAGIIIYKEKFAEELINRGIPQKYVLKYEYSYMDLSNYDEFVIFFNHLYDYYVWAMSKKDLEEFSKIVFSFCYTMAKEEQKLSNLLSLITSNEYNSADYEYFVKIIGIILKIQDNHKIQLKDEKLSNIIKKIKEKEKFNQPEYTKEQARVFNAIAVLLKEEKNDTNYK